MRGNTKREDNEDGSCRQKAAELVAFLTYSFFFVERLKTKSPTGEEEGGDGEELIRDIVSICELTHNLN